MMADPCDPYMQDGYVGGEQGMFTHLSPGVSLVDELIAELRAEAARDLITKKAKPANG